MRTGRMRTRWTAVRWAAAASCMLSPLLALVFIGVSLAQPQLNPLVDPVSLLVLGQGGGLVVAAFVASGVALVAAGASLWHAVRPSIAARAGAAGVALGGTQIGIMAAFPTDTGLVPTTAIGIAHATLSGIGLTLLPVSLVVLSWHFKRDASWGRVQRPARLIALLGLVAAGAYGLLSNLHGHSGLPGPFYDGLAERVTVAAILAWGLVVNVRLWRLAGERLEALPAPTPLPSEAMDGFAMRGGRGAAAGRTASRPPRSALAPPVSKP
ncbi:MAG: DUF998 domain-containing protein [Thermoplasmatota archaeon]